MLSREDEARLVARLKRRDERAFNQMVRLYQGRVYRLTLRMMGNPSDAEDVAQEVFVTVFKSIDGFRGESRLGTWLFRVTANHCKNRLKYLERRARGRKKAYDEKLHRDGGGPMPTTGTVAGPEAQAQGNELERRLAVALADLPEEQRSLVLLRDVENMSYEAIQNATGLAAGTVKSRLHRARLALHAALREPEPTGMDSTEDA